MRIKVLKISLVGLCCFYSLLGIAQSHNVTGSLLVDKEASFDFTYIIVAESQKVFEVDAEGNFTIIGMKSGKHTFRLLSMTWQAKDTVIDVQKDFVLKWNVQALDEKQLKELTITGELERTFGLEYMGRVRDFTLFEAKKHEIILLKNITANTATNNARQIFGGITGLNIWESDGAGLQLGIGGRGLSPNRTANFNTRQNGYDMSADALGYPETYYTPPMEALDRIEVIRGASSLQYGTQFGGMINFVFKEAPLDKTFQYQGRQTYGSWNFINSFNSFAGTSKNKKFSYYSFIQRKQGDGWRPNSEFEVNSGFVRLKWHPTAKDDIWLEYTRMNYLAKQPGGLSDANFRKDPTQSFRSRNWFQVNWEMLALNYTHRWNDHVRFNTRFFGLNAARLAVGNLERINVIDFNGNRTLIEGRFFNLGNESRLIADYHLFGKKHTAITGVRLYRGITTARQGDADATDLPRFDYLNPENVEVSDYSFPNINIAYFIENTFSITDKFTITPGLRFEHIETQANGYYRQRVFDFAGNVITDNRIEEAISRSRNFVIAGLGLQYKKSKRLVLYANFSQNYRAINFSDLRIQNPNFRIDPNLTDEKGYTADAGMRGNVQNTFMYELTAFYLYYNNRIGQVLRADQPPLFLDYRFRTNVSASRNIGVEAYGALSLNKLFHKCGEKFKWSIFVNGAYINARYINSEEPGLEGNEVEMVPDLIVRTGTAIEWKGLALSYQFNFTSEHFSDASNAVLTSTAVEGLIPSYSVSDLSLRLRVSKWLQLETSCNNLFNETYFTRRAESYPGPGIIPSDPRAFFATLVFTL